MKTLVDMYTIVFRKAVSQGSTILMTKAAQLNVIHVFCGWKLTTWFLNNKGQIEVQNQLLKLFYK